MEKQIKEQFLTKEIAEILSNWWNDDLTCSGEKTCSAEECDLCVDCFQRLCRKFNCEWNLNSCGNKVVAKGNKNEKR